MKFKKWISTTAAAILLAASLSATPAVHAEDKKTIADESIYDLLVDRFFNNTGANDYVADPTDPSKFAGGDFLGLIDKVDFIGKMGYTVVSIGSVFATEKYDGSMVTSYSKLERHFGTAEELDQAIDVYNKKKIRMMVDFPLNNVSPNHEWAKDAAKKSWIASTENGQIQWDYQNKDVQQAVKAAVVDFVKAHKIGGLRLTDLGTADEAFINKVIDAVKAVNKDIYVISNEESDANFDATFSSDTNAIYRDIFKNVDRESSKLDIPYKGYLEEKEKPAQLMFDSLDTGRFTYNSATENMFPPTRLKMALATLMALPGVPVVQYGSEIAMNGKAAPEAHQIYNFKTDDELIKYVENLQMLRNKSETLRNGKFELVKNENGLLVIRRTSKDESWVIVVNNTGETQRVDFTPEELGKEKELRGMFDNDIVPLNKKGEYAIVLDREMAEYYQVIDKRGINVSYMVALSLVYILFIGFIYAIIRRGRARRREN